METVQPIRDLKQIEEMKKKLLAQSARDHLLFVLGINSGLRISDILRLRIRDVMDHGGRPRTFFRLIESRTMKEKTFPFGENVRNAINLYVEETGQWPDSDEYLFKSRMGSRPISRQRAHQILNQAARSVGIQDKIGTHTLRKTFGYHAYKSGVDITWLKSIFNHSAPSVTLRYIGVTEEETDDIVIDLNL
ncbi:MAG: site-specific integrase [Firmicutes bacterium]|uniref:Phage integrase family protein n=1 Tax=Melghirimyces thermohalophilus TaxID=1236220 RepID=A0A1G6JHH9_9BACL|nr:site-specific integrase [Melghirimyces thermohalophilus]MDA8354034.1 site-specific integrase [Bacillota bacterium]SDC18108.1 Phage integrase family protein [Melghirimyces thermohalophilus]